MNKYCLFIIISFFLACSANKHANKWYAGLYYSEQDMFIIDTVNKINIRVNAPENQVFDFHKKTLLIFYALPNGNTIAQTMGKTMEPGDDWHFDIQHIAAQTRYIRDVMKDYNVVVSYMAAHEKSWPLWKKQTPGAALKIKSWVDSIAHIFARYKPQIVLDSHSGGGSFIFGYLDAVTTVPDNIKRIAFIDSDYGYEDSLYGKKLTQWLRASNDHYLDVLAYNDSVVIYNGKPLVSPTGGTWYRSKMMQRKLSESFPFTVSADTSFIHYTALNKRIDILLKENPEGKIYHTEQVARNGFIHTILSGTRYEQDAGYVYWGERAYRQFIK